MEPLYSPDLTSAFTWALSLVLFGIGMTLVAAFLSDNWFKHKIIPITLYTGAAIFIGSLISLIVVALVMSSQEDTTVKDRIKLMDTTYGVSVTEDVYKDLNYPKKAPEEGTFSSYGSIPIITKQSGKVEQTEVALVWDETEFQLVNISNGPTEAEELPRLEK